MSMTEPQSRFYASHGLNLHYADWGNEAAPLLLLIHGGQDHCRSWDRIARAMQPHYHVVAPDLRGHGDSDWTKGGSYALTEYVYDVARLVQTLGADKATIAGHSMGGMVSLIYSGSFPERVEKLVVLDGVTVMPSAQRAPPHERIEKYVTQLEAVEGRVRRPYATLEEAAAKMTKRNTRLTPELALHLAQHGARRVEGGWVWKFDPHQRVMAPHRLWPEDHVALWERIACPTLLLGAEKSFFDAEKVAAVAGRFQNARAEKIADAGHWVQHDEPEEVLRLMREFLGV